MSLYKILTESVEIFEAVDPFAAIVSQKGKSMKKSFVMAARKDKLNNVAIFAGLELIKRNDELSSKYQWTIDDILLQVSGKGLFLSKELKDEYIDTEANFGNDFAQKAGRKVADNIVKNFKEMEELKNDMIDTNMSSIPKKPVHEFNKSQRAELKDAIVSGFKFHDIAVKNGYPAASFEVDAMPELLQKLSKELAKIEKEYEFPEDYDIELKKAAKTIREMIEKNILWENPDEEIKKVDDVVKYFKQLDKSEPEQKEAMEKTKTRHIHKEIMKKEGVDTKEAMKKMKDNPDKYDPRVAKKESKDLRSEEQEYKETIRKAAKELKKELAGSEVVGDEEIKHINKKAEHIAKHKLSTGRSIETYLNKIEKVEDAISEIAGEISKKIK